MMRKPDKLKIIENSRAAALKNASICGNAVFRITRAQLEALLAGRALTGWVNDEYAIFLAVKPRFE